MVSSSRTVGHAIYGPIYSFVTIPIPSMSQSASSASKKAVLVRIPTRMYSDLLNLFSAATLLQRTSVSVPSLIVDILEEALRKRPIR